MQEYLVPWMRQDWPIRWQAFFGRSGPLALEVGFGNGAFLVEQAVRKPEIDWIGIERSWGSITRLFARLNSARVKNVKVLEGDAEFLLRHMFALSSIEQVHVNFPDPWPKKRHCVRRLIQPDFIGILTERLAQEGVLTIATDHAGYASWISKVLEAEKGLRLAASAIRDHALADCAATRYEEKALAAGAAIHYAVWQKKSCRALPNHSRRLLIEPMPNVTLKANTDFDPALDGIASSIWKERNDGVDVLIKMVGVYKRQEALEQIIEVFVKEGKLTQCFGIIVVGLHDSRWLIKLSEMGYPRPTWGVKRSLWHVAQWLVERYPQMRVSSSTVG